MNRHRRQMRLPLVGARGQKLLAEATLEIGASGDEGAICARYLAGAGVGRLHVVDEASAQAARAIDAQVEIVVGATATAHVAPMADLDDLDPAARAVARGSRAAVRALVGVLRERAE